MNVIQSRQPPQSISRGKIKGIARYLGFDPNEVLEVDINPNEIYVTVIVRDDNGEAVIEDGMVVLRKVHRIAVA